MIKKIAPDKWKHFFVGIGMGTVLQAFSVYLLQDHFFWATFIAFILVVLISYGFELFSKFTGLGHYDFMDAVASVVGGIIGMGATLLIQINF